MNHSIQVFEENRPGRDTRENLHPLLQSISSALRRAGVQGVAESQSAQTSAGLAHDPDSESARTLQLLLSGGQQPRLVDVLQGSGEVAVQVVKSTGSKAKSDMAQAEASAGALCVSDASQSCQTVNRGLA